MLQKERGWQFTLREVARRAGVSHAAPYKHFPDKAALLAELAMIGFDRLREALLSARPATAESLGDQLVAVARAYIAFGTDHPALYRLMFSGEEGGVAAMHSSERALAVFEVVLDILQTGQAEGSVRARPIRGQALACWGLVHGLTTLSIEGLLLPEKVGPTPIDSALRSLVEGIGTPVP